MLKLRKVKTVEELKAMPEWKNLRDHIRFQMIQAYSDQEFIESKTDGISMFPDWMIGWAKPGYVPAVTHDHIRAKKLMPNIDSDIWYAEACWDMINYARASWHYIILRTVGKPYAWITDKISWIRQRNF